MASSSASVGGKAVAGQGLFTRQSSGLVRELGISPVGVTLGSVALANLFFHARPDADGKTFVLADLKPGRLEVLALRDGALAYTREVSRPEEKPWKACVLEELEVAAAKTGLEPEETIEELIHADRRAARLLGRAWQHAGCLQHPPLRAGAG